MLHRPSQRQGAEKGLAPRWVFTPAYIKPPDVFIDAVLGWLSGIYLAGKRGPKVLGDREATGPVAIRSADVGKDLSTHGVGEGRKCVLLRPRSGFGES